jgi:hypothetical protein
MIENTGFAAFAMFNALKLHFTSDSYDYFKYHGKTNVSKQTFSIRKDKYSFYRLSRKFNLEELRNFYIANFLVEDIQWVGDMTGPEGDENYKKWQKTQQSLTYTFENDTIYLFEKYKPGEMFKISGSYPNLLKELMEDNIHIETIVYMNMMMGFLPVWKKEIEEDIIWPNWELKMRKYQPFLFDQSKIQKLEDILKERIADAKAKNKLCVS